MQENQINGSVVTKMAVGAIVMTAFVATVSIRVMVKTHGDDVTFDPIVAATIVISSASVGAILGAVLALKDRVQQRLAKGERISFILRLLFGSGSKSLTVWIGFVFFVCLVVLPILLAINTG